MRELRLWLPWKCFNAAEILTISAAARRRRSGQAGPDAAGRAGRSGHLASRRRGARGSRRPARPTAQSCISRLLWTIWQRTDGQDGRGGGGQPLLLVHQRVLERLPRRVDLRHTHARSALGRGGTPRASPTASPSGALAGGQTYGFLHDLGVHPTRLGHGRSDLGRSRVVEGSTRPEKTAVRGPRAAAGRCSLLLRLKMR